MYLLHAAFPEIIGTEETLRGIGVEYFVRFRSGNGVKVDWLRQQSSGLHIHSWRHDSWSNRSSPKFLELDDGWPFLWFEHEYVVDTVTSFILAAMR
jgi:endoglucanase